jgi:branched-chain amino acid transport system ATP-binding protein
MPEANAFLQFNNVSVYYRAVEAIKDVSFHLKKGEILTLIGANGAGKSTTLRAISGLVKISSGEIRYQSTLLSGMKTHDIVKKRICQVPEGRGIFLNLSVEDNLDLGAWTWRDKQDYADTMAYVFELFPRLHERRKQNAGTLSGGEQQMLAIGRALMGHPDLLLLDEPSLGLAPQIIEKIFEIIKTINKEGKTILLVEQNALQALEVADHCVVLETGKVIASGKAKELLHSDMIRKAYLGG